MGAWTTALNELRQIFADGSQSRYAYRKKIFGQVDGVNATFKTFEGRRVDNFTAPTNPSPPVGIYVSGTLLAASAVQADDPVSGEFTLVTPPAKLTGGSPTVLTATYYYEWLLDSELTSFLTNAANWLTIGPDFTTIPPGLQPAAKAYAAKDALNYAAMRWSERASSIFLLEDAPKKEALGIAETYQKQAQNYLKEATQLRNDYYTRSGQALAPTFVSNFGRVSAVTPRR